MDSGKPTPNQAAATTYLHCFACRYFHVGRAQCRRWPPDAHPITGDIGWPFVEADDWCGEFESRETPPRFWPPGPLENTDASFRERVIAKHPALSNAWMPGSLERDLIWPTPSAWFIAGLALTILVGFALLISTTWR